MIQRTATLVALAVLLACGFGGLSAAVADDAPPTAKQPKPAAEKAGEARPKRRPLLWMVEGTPRVYLYGTIHVADPRVTKHLPVVQAALDQSTALYTELPLDAAGQAQMQMEVMQKAALPTGKTLPGLLGDKLYRRVEKLMPPQMPLSFLNGFKPWMIQFLLTQTLMKEHQAKLARDAARKAAASSTPEGDAPATPERPSGPAQALDPMLYANAQKAGKRVGGLETIGTQIDVFDSLTYAAQVKMVTQLVEEIEKVRAEAKKEQDGAETKDGSEDGSTEAADSHVNALSQMIDMWLAGDDQAFLDVFEQDLRKSTGEEADKFVRGLLDDRNAGMVIKLLHLMLRDANQTYFIAVGAGHMPGERGIVRLLEKAGFKVRRMERGARCPPLPEKADAPKKEPVGVK